MKKFVGLKVKTYSYLMDDGSEDKKAKDTKKCDIRRKLKFKDYKNCLKVIQLENKMYKLEKNKVNSNSLRENHNEFVKNNRLILKTQQ